MRFGWLPNAICVMRMLLVVPLMIALLGEHYGAAVILLVVAGVSDGLDGFLAKTFGWQTRLGSLLDPAADKLLLVSVFVGLAYLRVVPVELTAIVVGRDVLIVFGALAYQFLIEPLQGEPGTISKLNTACQLAFVLFAMTNAGFDWPPRAAVLIFGAAVVFTSLVSGLSYVLGWSRRAWRVAHASA